MPRFAANLSMLFTEVPMLERFERAARAGFSTVEMQFPYEAPAAAIRERLSANRLKMVLHNLPAGDWAAGDRGIACDPASGRGIPGRRRCAPSNTPRRWRCRSSTAWPASRRPASTTPRARRTLVATCSMRRPR